MKGLLKKYCDSKWFNLTLFIADFIMVFILITWLESGDHRLYDTPSASPFYPQLAWMVTLLAALLIVHSIRQFFITFS